MPKTNPYANLYNDNGTVTIWCCYRQQWMTTDEPSDRLLSTLTEDERERIAKHLAS